MHHCGRGSTTGMPLRCRLRLARATNSEIGPLPKVNVRTTLEMLRDANVRTWMLTGDKLETAKIVAQVCCRFPPTLRQPCRSLTHSASSRPLLRRTHHLWHGTNHFTQSRHTQPMRRVRSSMDTHRALSTPPASFSTGSRFNSASHIISNFSWKWHALPQR